MCDSYAGCDSQYGFELDVVEGEDVDEDEDENEDACGSAATGQAQMET